MGYDLVASHEPCPRAKRVPVEMVHRVTRALLAGLKFRLKYPELFRFARDLRAQEKTYLSLERMMSLVESFMQLRDYKGRVEVAEFGVGRGGSAMLLYTLAGRYGGSLVLFDAFGPTPAPTAVDGVKAAERFREIESYEGPDYYGNIADLRQVIEDEVRSVSEGAPLELVEGLYQDTLPRLAQRRAFDLVHLDCDWYESTKAALEYLRANLANYAILQIDDYSFWPGCKLAVDEADWLRGHPGRMVGRAIVITFDRGNGQRTRRNPDT